MGTWILENIATLMIGGLLIAAVAAIIIHMVRNRKKGKNSCGCGCSNCPMSDSCHPKT